AHLRRGLECKPGVRAQWPAHRLHLHPRRQETDLHHRAHRQGSETDDENRQQRTAGLVEVTGESTMRRLAPLALIFVLTTLACGKKTPPVTRPMPPPAASTTPDVSPPPAPPSPVPEPTSVPAEPVREDAI